MIRKIFTLCAAAVALVACKGTDTIALFNGENLDGWIELVRDTTGLTSFSAAAGVISTTGQPYGVLRTEESYSDFSLHLEWRWADGIMSDSGIFVMVQDEDVVWPMGVQVQLLSAEMCYFIPSRGAQIEGLVQEEGHYAVKPRTVEEDPQSPVGEWNSMDISCSGGHISVSLNGVLVNETDCGLSSGRIALQAEGGPLQFRNILLTQ